MNFGAVYENAVAQELAAHGFEPNYYVSREHGEIDFVLERDAQVVLLEVKSGKHYGRHRALNRVMNDPEYSVGDAIVLNDASLKCQKGVFYAPVYMIMFLCRKDMPETMPYEIGAPLDMGGRQWLSF